MEEVLILAVALTAIAVLVGLARGIRAIQLSQQHPNRFTLRLAALNLLEPSVTIGVIFAVFLVTDAWNSRGVGILPLEVFFVLKGQLNPRGAIPLLMLLAAIPLTVMLLASLATRIESALHRVIAVYGGLRWLNTVALWVVALTGDRMDGGWYGDGARIALMDALIVTGISILGLSVAHIGSSLRIVRTQSAE